MQRSQKPLGAKKNKYYADKIVIDTIIEIVSNEPLELTELITRVREEKDKSEAKCREIVDRYKGNELDDLSSGALRQALIIARRWSCRQ